jgi:hypothetical protein
MLLIVLDAHRYPVPRCPHLIWLAEVCPADRKSLSLYINAASPNRLMDSFAIQHHPPQPDHDRPTRLSRSTSRIEYP